MGSGGEEEQRRSGGGGGEVRVGVGLCLVWSWCSILTRCPEPRQDQRSGDSPDETPSSRCCLTHTHTYHVLTFPLDPHVGTFIFTLTC